MVSALSAPLVVLSFAVIAMATTVSPSASPTPPPKCGGFDHSCATLTVSDVWDSSVGENASRLLAAALVGAIVGLQREFGYILNRLFLKINITDAQVLGKRTAKAGSGLQTHMLVSIGSCLYTIQSGQGFAKELPYSLGNVVGDPSRVAAAVVTGVGFLGAGSIIKENGKIQGLTTAASIWVTASLGMAAGTSSNNKDYLETTLIALGVVIFCLQFLGIIEHAVHNHFQRVTKDILECICVLNLNPLGHTNQEAAIAEAVDQIVQTTKSEIGNVTSMSTSVQRMENGELQLHHSMVTEVGLEIEAPSVKFTIAMEGIVGFVRASTSLGSMKSAQMHSGTDSNHYGSIPMVQPHMARKSTDQGATLIGKH